MAYISFQPSDYFNTVLWTGNSDSDDANQTITGVGFKPDLFWSKIRNAADEHHLKHIDIGNTTKLRPNSTAAANTSACSVVPNSDGFVITGDDGLEFNKDGNNYVTWNWRGAGSTSSNTDGSISSTVSANTTSGFSIVKYTGTGANATVGHGLGVQPSVVFVKNLNSVENWVTGHLSLGFTKCMFLNLDSASATSSTRWNDTDPTTSVFSLGTETQTNKSGDEHIAYVFAEKKGFSKFGSYSSNNNTDGPFIYTGFSPAFVIIKSHNTAVRNWTIQDNKRSSSGGPNPNDKWLYANVSDAEVDQASNPMDFLSNGFKLRNNGSYQNQSEHIYMAFAEHPLVSSNDIPATAR